MVKFVTPDPEIASDFGISQGLIAIYAKCSTAFLNDLEMDAGFGNFRNYSSIIQQREELCSIAESKDSRVTVAVLRQKVLVGYFACHYPKHDERWSKLGELMYELGALEVSRNFRKHGIARKLIKPVLSETFIEDKITFMVGYSWTWDVNASGFTLEEYRNVHLKLLEPYNFQEFYTNELNVRMRDENIFMARIGSRVGPSDVKRFRRLALGIIDY